MTATGEREVLGLDVGPSEDGAFWRSFLRGLVARGLSGVKLVTSDDHEGLKGAIAAVLQGAGWQRCRVRKTGNVTQKVREAGLPEVKADILSAYYASRQEVARLVADAVVKKWQAVYPSAMASFVDDFEACIAYLRCPPAHHKFIRTANLAERAI